MDQELPKYSYRFIGGDQNRYVFETENLIEYEVKFTATPYLFGEESFFAEHIVELSLVVTDNPTGELPLFDRLTSNTVAAIFTDFYRRSDETITIYICASYDNRQLLRERAFNRWFDKFTKVERHFVKMSSCITDADGTVYPVTLIIKEHNPYAVDIATAFNRLVWGYNAGK
jgi:hypothetical protein